MEVAIGTPPTNINSQVSGGVIGGLLNARSQVLDPTAASLGKIATALTTAVNSQNAQGVDLNGNLGAAIFSTPTPTVLAATTNHGSASVSATVSDPSQLTGSNYIARYDGSQWSLTQAGTNTSVPMTGAGTAASPFTAAGMSFQVSGTPSSGDSYMIEPTQNASGQIQMVMTDASQIAAAGAVTPSASSSNTGSGTIALSAVTNSSDPNLATSVTIKFTSASTYSVNGSGSYSYTAGSAISMNGWTVAISGTPASGDSFSIGKTARNSGDNSNANLIAGLSSKNLLDGGSNSVTSANVSLVSKTGTTAQQASASATAAQSVLTQTQSQLSSTSGVNLDQEAADLLRFQNAYQAAAQVISTGQNLFQSLLTAVRGG
jgi:flagellar hook-associated protein 1 FlgK